MAALLARRVVLRARKEARRAARHLQGSEALVLGKDTLLVDSNLIGRQGRMLRAYGGLMLSLGWCRTL